MTTAQDRTKFATYLRDSASGLDYAQQRYDARTMARFTSPDPHPGSAQPGAPQTWNRYAYALNDPANFNDPSGMQVLMGGSIGNSIFEPGPMPPAPPFSPRWFGSGKDLWDNTSWAFEIGLGPGPFWAGDADVVYRHPGIEAAINGLYIISQGGFKAKPKCRDFFAALIRVAGLEMEPDELMDQVVAIAFEAYSHGYVYDGPSSTTPLDPEKFPGAASKGVTTVGEWFDAYSGRLALSQYNGSAIWIRQGLWVGFFSPFVTSGSANRYGLGTLLHEILHKQTVGGGFTHYPGQDQIGAALRLTGRKPIDFSGQNGISRELGVTCF